MLYFWAYILIVIHFFKNVNTFLKIADFCFKIITDTKETEPHIVKYVHFAAAALTFCVKNRSESRQKHKIGTVFMLFNFRLFSF